MSDLSGVINALLTESEQRRINKLPGNRSIPFYESERNGLILRYFPPFEDVGPYLITVSNGRSPYPFEEGIILTSIRKITGVKNIVTGDRNGTREYHWKGVEDETAVLVPNGRRP